MFPRAVRFAFKLKIITIFSIFLLLFFLSFPVYAVDFEYVLLNDSKISTEDLGMERSESVSGSGASEIVEDTFDFHMPYFINGEDAELMHEFSFGERDYFGDVVIQKVNGKDFVLLYLGSYGIDEPYEEGFLDMKEIVFNSVPLDQRSTYERGWVRMTYADGSENLLIYLQLDDFLRGDRNILKIRYHPSYSVKVQNNYNEKLNLYVGRFYSVINVSYNATPLDNNSTNVTFHVSNIGKAKQMSEAKFYLFFNGSQLQSNQVAIDLINYSMPGHYVLSLDKTTFDSKKSYYVLDIDGITFQDVDEINVTLMVKLKIKNKNISDSISLTPAYSYNDANITFLDEARLSFRGSCKNDSDCRGSDVCSDGTCHQSKLYVIYLPLNWNANPNAIERIAAEHNSFLVGSIPGLSNCSHTARKMIVTKPLLIANISQMNESEVLGIIKTHVNLDYGDDYDFIVALTGRDSLPANVAGYTHSEYRVVVSYAGKSVVTAHEIGHKFGLSDEYCSCPGQGHCNEEPNPLKTELGCDVNGDCCWENFKIGGLTLWDNDCPEPYGCSKCCLGNKNKLGGRSIMSWGDAPEPRYHDNFSLDHLEKNPMLRCDQ